MVLKTFYYHISFSHHRISQRALWTALEMQLDPSRGGSVHAPVYVRKHIATCDFPGGGLDPALPPLDLTMQNVASGKELYCLLTECYFRNCI